MMMKLIRDQRVKRSRLGNLSSLSLFMKYQRILNQKLISTIKILNTSITNQTNSQQMDCSKRTLLVRPASPVLYTRTQNWSRKDNLHSVNSMATAEFASQTRLPTTSVCSKMICSTARANSCISTEKSNKAFSNKISSWDNTENQY